VLITIAAAPGAAPTRRGRLLTVTSLCINRWQERMQNSLRIMKRHRGQLTKTTVQAPQSPSRNPLSFL